MMKAISIQQPWAWAILHAGKDVENRTWYHEYRGLVLIHAGKKFDHEGYAWLIEQALYNDKISLTIDDIPPKGAFKTGGIVGQVFITGMVRSLGFSPWMFGPWGWVLENPKPLQFVPYCGRLGLFNVNDILQLSECGHFHGGCDLQPHGGDGCSECAHRRAIYKKLEPGMLIKTNYSGPYRIVDIERGCTCPFYLDELNMEDPPAQPPHLHLTLSRPDGAGRYYCFGK